MKKEYNIQLVRNIIILFCLLFGFMLFFSLPVKAADVVPITPNDLVSFVDINKLDDYYFSIKGVSLYDYDAFAIRSTLINGRFGQYATCEIFLYDNCKPKCNSGFYSSPNAFFVVDPERFSIVSQVDINVEADGSCNTFYDRSNTGFFWTSINYLYGVDVYLDDGSETLMVYANDKPNGDDIPTEGGFVIPDYSDIFSSVDGSVSPVADLLKPSDSSNLFGLAAQGDKLETVVNNNIANPNDSTGGLLTKIANTIQQGFLGITNFLKNYFSNLQLLLQNIVNNIANQFNSLKEYLNSIKTVFDDFLNLGLDFDGNFSIALAIRRLLIPDDFTQFNAELTTFINDIDARVPVKVYINSIKELFNTIKTQNIPTITIPSFTIGGSTIPETIISFQFLVPYMGYIRAIMSAFMWLAFILFCIKDFPNLLRGSFSTVEHSIGHVPNDGSHL